MAYNLEARECLWNNQASDIFRTTASEPSGADQEKLFRDLVDAHKTTIRLWWNIKSLETYLKLEMAPRGLRVQIFPALEVTSQFKDIWEKGLGQCSCILMSLLIGHDKELLGATKSHINSLEEQLSQGGEMDEALNGHLQDILDKYEKEIMSGKKCKFVRDKNDYERKEAFRWRHKGNKRGGKFAPRNDNRVTNNTPDTSSTDFFIIRNVRRRGRTRRGKRKKKDLPIQQHEDKEQGEIQTVKEDSLKMINLTDKILSSDEQSVLKKGPTFSP